MVEEAETSSDDEVDEFSPTQVRKRNIHTAYGEGSSIENKKKKKTASVRPRRIEDDDDESE